MTNFEIESVLKMKQCGELLGFVDVARIDWIYIRTGTFSLFKFWFCWIRTVCSIENYLEAFVYAFKAFVWTLGMNSIYWNTMNFILYMQDIFNVIFRRTRSLKLKDAICLQRNKIIKLQKYFTVRRFNSSIQF